MRAVLLYVLLQPAMYLLTAWKHTMGFFVACWKSWWVWEFDKNIFV